MGRVEKTKSVGERGRRTGEIGGGGEGGEVERWG